MGYTFDEDIFVIDCWLDTKEKEETLINLIKRVKVYNVPILLCGHYPVNPEIQQMVDYYLYDGKNDILLEKDFSDYQVASDRWTIMNDYKVINKVGFHHDYAIWETMRSAFKFVQNLGKKYIHFLEFDNLPDEVQYRQAFMEYLRGNDAVVLEYSKDSTKENSPYCATYIFSIRTDVAVSLINKINTKEEYFKNRPNGWQLEKVFYQTLREVTGSIFVSKYIPNNEELNIYAAWNRNGILRNGARFQTYLAMDDSKLHVHFISGFSEAEADKDYLVEVNYSDRKFFYNITKGGYHLQSLGDYKQGETVRVFYQGVEVFSETLKDEPNEFKRKNKLEWRNRKSNLKINVNFVDGAFVEILDDVERQYNVKFVNKKNDKVEFEINLKSNQWAKSSIKYFVDWEIRIKGIDNDYEESYRFNPKDNKFLISFETKSLGDNIAFISYVEEFRKKHNCKVVCSTFFNDLFKKQYPEIEFIIPGTNVNNIYGLYRLGIFYNDRREINYEYHPINPIKEPLLKVASDILGLQYKEVKPKLPTLGKKKSKMVTIAVHSTAQAKYWNNKKGWQEVVDYLKGKGYEVRLLSREEDGYMGNINPKGVTIQPASDIKGILKTIQESEFFIGISSGLSWLAWGGGVPVVLISGFTDEYLEPFDGIQRVINKDVCNSCWHNYEFNPGDWYWCPVHKNTDRQFECSKEITSKSVIEKIENLI
jgi:autotransporter strand-loop-strand O-heptosyltransferase